MMHFKPAFRYSRAFAPSIRVMSSIMLFSLSTIFLNRIKRNRLNKILFACKICAENSDKKTVGETQFRGFVSVVCTCKYGVDRELTILNLTSHPTEQLQCYSIPIWTNLRIQTRHCFNEGNLAAIPCPKHFCFPIECLNSTSHPQSINKGYKAG